ncbi:hypothetical protein LZ198_08530 [Myxococcus sp. K15C18031901]|uniref:hypothetical protein n=1 Tax=Myxococcus dinghuensis TaxID=2906761 RepID=UPI0020A75340|nr:hypothetical protein [Myxococcus dinghuensis]MCP3098920.1 hypothetical protein [Myxococcus dinghuensis]
MLYHQPKDGPWEYEDLREPSDVLRPWDLVTVVAALAGHLRRAEAKAAQRHRALALALFACFGMDGLSQREQVERATDGEALLVALGAEDKVGDPLAHAWKYRRQLLAMPNPRGHLEGHPYWLSFPSRLPDLVRPMAERVSDRMLAHAQAAAEIVRDLDRVIVSLWGCPPERLDDAVTLARLASQGIDFEPPRSNHFDDW